LTRYLLDTNMVSHLLRAHPEVVKRVIATPITSLCISAITEGELLFELAKRPSATKLQLSAKDTLQKSAALMQEVLPRKPCNAIKYIA